MGINYTKLDNSTMHYIGIDIGGTTIKGARVDDHGAISESARTPTPSDDLEELLSEISQLVEKLRKDSRISGIGVGIPGLRASDGVMQTSPHIPCIRGINLEQRLESALKIPVVTENDANAGAYGEWALGAGKGMQHIAYVTLGTGLGCGLIFSGDLFRGSSGYAGELGHTAVEPEGRQCACGARGCLETRVSATGIVETARELGLIDGFPTAASVYEAAVGGNGVAKAVFQQTGRYLGLACANLINLLNLEAIVFGGGVMASGNLLLDTVREEVRLRAFPPSAAACQIVQSQLWPDSGTIGAAMLARDRS